MDESADTTATSPPAAPAADAAPAAPPAVARSIGERLRAGREKAGLGIAAAAEKLHLDPKVIEALENDRFAEVGASVYVRGHLRRYGDFVGENGTELVGMYQTRESRPVAPDLTQVPQPERRVDPRRLVTPAIVVGAGAVLLSAIWWVLGSSRAPDRAAAAAPIEGASTAVSEAGTPAEAVTAGSALPAPAAVVATPVTLSNAPTVASTSTSTSASPAATPAVAPKEASPPKETQLRLELSGDSWVEVYDYRGERLYFDVASSGSVQSVSGRGPLRVVLENAAAVTIEVDGQRREVPAGALEGERARFIVNRSGSLSRARQ
jgi:cytoskeleton protein RodZ